MVWDVLVAIAPIIVTAIAVALAQYYFRRRGEQKEMYRGFLKEIRQNIHFAQHNISKLEKESTKIELLSYRDDFWKMSLSGYLLDLPSDLQDLLYKIYMKQYVNGEKLMKLRENKMLWNHPHVKIDDIKKEINEEILSRLKNAEEHLEKILGS